MRPVKARSGADPAQTHKGRLADAAFLADAGVRRILALLNGEGEEVRVVGGAVRNTLLGLDLTRKSFDAAQLSGGKAGSSLSEASDIDLCTTALPQEVMRRAARAGIHAVPTGIEHGTVTLVVDHVPFEVTTLRADIATDGRHAQVRFGRDFAEDALRRDFTINALSVSAEGSVHDYVGGMADIAARRVRFIGEADQRIREDYLRILRLFRFSAGYGGGVLDPDGLSAVLRHREGLGRLSRERIGKEMMKLLVQTHAVSVVGLMAEHGFLEPVLGGPGDVARFARLAGIEAALGVKPDAVCRLAALGAFSAGDSNRLQERLRLSNVVAERVRVMGGALVQKREPPTPNPSPPQAGGGERAHSAAEGLPESQVATPPETQGVDGASPPPVYGGEGCPGRSPGRGGGRFLVPTADQPRPDRTDPRTGTARRLRGDATPFEKRLWPALRSLDIPGHFRRQTPVGPYFADFAHHGLKLVIELDGEQHGQPDRQQRDGRRDAWFEQQGYRVLRFWNHEVSENFDGVVETILAKIAEIDPSTGIYPPREISPAGFLSGSASLPPTPNPSPPQAGGGERARSAGEEGLTSAANRERLYRLGPEAYRDVILAEWAGSGAGPEDPDWTAALRLPEIWTAPKFLISGKHVMSAGIPKGPMVGRILAAVEDDWIAAGMPEEEAAQLAILKAVKEE